MMPTIKEMMESLGISGVDRGGNNIDACVWDLLWMHHEAQRALEIAKNRVELLEGFACCDPPKDLI